MILLWLSGDIWYKQWTKRVVSPFYELPFLSEKSERIFQVSSIDEAEFVFVEECESTLQFAKSFFTHLREIFGIEPEEK